MWVVRGLISAIRLNDIIQGALKTFPIIRPDPKRKRVRIQVESRPPMPVASYPPLKSKRRIGSINRLLGQSATIRYEVLPGVIKLAVPWAVSV